MTLLDLGQSIMKIRETLNSIEVKGEANAALIVYGIKKCNDLIEAINNTLKERDEELQNGSDNTQTIRQ